MNTIARVILVAMLACGSGCAKPDWIQQTLVTVDVTGAWSGDCIRGGAGGIPGGIIEMTLEQSGTKVTGQTRTSPSRSWGIDGTINGDVFRFSTQAGVSGRAASSRRRNGWTGLGIWVGKMPAPSTDLIRVSPFAVTVGGLTTRPA
jgi:hypothetical protein